jgi:hypothetical protein
MKNIKYYLFAILITSFTSCLEGDPIFEDGGSAGIVELDLAARTTSTSYAVRSNVIEVEDAVELPVVVNYTGVNGAPQDVQVTLSIDDAIISTYGGGLSALPTDYYELPASNVVTIPKGQKKATYTIKLKPRLFDLTKSYALGVKIVSATAGTISGNYSAGVYSIPVKSPWEGIYDVHYKWYAGAGYGTADEEYDETEISLSTVGPGVLEAKYIGVWFSGATRYTFYPDKTVGVAAYNGSTIYATTVIESSADPDNLTFKVKWSFPASNGYVLEETYVKIDD